MEPGGKCSSPFCHFILYCMIETNTCLRLHVRPDVTAEPVKSVHFSLRAVSWMYGRSQELEVTAVWVTFAHMGSDKCGGEKERRACLVGWRRRGLHVNQAASLQTGSESRPALYFFFCCFFFCWEDESLGRVPAGLLVMYSHGRENIYPCAVEPGYQGQRRINLKGIKASDPLSLSPSFPCSFSLFLSSCWNYIVTRSGDEVNFASFLRTCTRLPIPLQRALKTQCEAPIHARVHRLHCDVFLYEVGRWGGVGGGRGGPPGVWWNLPPR